MARLLSTVVGLTALGAVACEPPATSEMLRITYGSGEFAPPVEADTLCNNGGCDGLEQLEAQLTFEEADGSFLSSDAYVEIAQYQVSYDLFGVEDPEDQPPYYANLTTVICNLGETVTFNVRAVGQRQREFVLARYGSDQIDGTGTLALAGLDHRGTLVLVDAPFDISFADFVDDEDADAP